MQKTKHHTSEEELQCVSTSAASAGTDRQIGWQECSVEECSQRDKEQWEAEVLAWSVSGGAGEGWQLDVFTSV